MSDEYDQQCNIFYQEGYMQGSGDYDPSMGESIAQGIMALGALATKYQKAFNDGYRDGVRHSNPLYQKYAKQIQEDHKKK